MIVNYIGNRPINLTLESGFSLHLYPKQKGIEISEQDWHMSSQLKTYKDRKLFKVIQDFDAEEVDKKPTKSKKKTELVFEEPKVDFEKQPETVEVNTRGRKAVASGKKTDELHKLKKRLKKNVKVIKESE